MNVRSGLQSGAITLGMFLMATTVDAALSVSPTRVVLQAAPAETQTGFFVVENTGDDPIDVSVEPEDWSGGMQGDRASVQWLTVRPKRLTLRPRKSVRVKYTIHVPNDASGELRAQVFFTTERSGGSIPMRSRLGTIIYVGIEETEHIEGEIRKVDASYTASTPGIAKPDRLDVAIQIRNRGNVHIVPEGRVVIRDAEGRTVATVLLQPGWGLLPHEEELYHAIGQGVYLSAGRYTVDVTILCGGDLHHPIPSTRAFEAVVTDTGTLQLESPHTPSAPHTSSAP